MNELKAFIAFMMVAGLSGCQTTPVVSSTATSQVTHASLPAAAIPNDNPSAALMPPDPERVRLKELVAQLESDLSVSDSRIQDLSSENEVLLRESQRLEDRVTSLQASVQQGRQELVEAESRAREMESQVIESQKQASMWKAAAEEQDRRNQSLQRDHEQELNRLLTTLNDMIRQFESQGMTVPTATENTAP